MAAALAGLAGVGAALGAAACGGGGDIPGTFTTNIPGPITQVSAASTASTASTASNTTSTGATTSTGTSTGATTGGTTSGETGPGGAGDEEGTRVPAIFSLKAGKLTPPTVSVPAFLAAEVTVTSTDAQAHTVLVKVGKGYTFAVAPRGSGTVKVPGQKGGKFTILVDGKPAGTLTWGGEPGP
jgi:hypothetical protein